MAIIASNLIKPVSILFGVICLLCIFLVSTQNETVMMIMSSETGTRDPIKYRSRSYSSVYGDGKSGTDSGPLATMRKLGHSYNLRHFDVRKMSTKESILTTYSYLDNVDIICYRKLRMGKLGDGGWEICDDPDVRPKERDCIIYSFGINNDFSFDDHAAKSYGCHIYSFDPSMKDKQHDRGNLVHFYPWGIGGKTEVLAGNKWQMYTFQDIKKKLGHENKIIDVVKMDIERSEFPVLTNMLISNMLDPDLGIKQLLVEYHVKPKQISRATVQILSDLERVGFRRFYVHKNQYCKTAHSDIPWTVTRCWEIHYMRPST